MEQPALVRVGKPSETQPGSACERGPLPRRARSLTSTNPLASYRRTTHRRSYADDPVPQTLLFSVDIDGDMKLETHEAKVRPGFNVNQCAQPLSFTAIPEDMSFEIQGDGDGGVVLVDSSSVYDASWRSQYVIGLNFSGPPFLAGLPADAQISSGKLSPSSRSSLSSICSLSPEQADGAGITLNAEKTQRHTSTTSSASTWSSASAPISADASASLRTPSPLSTFLEDFPSPPSPLFSPHRRESKDLVDTLPPTYEELCSLPTLPPSPEPDIQGTPKAQGAAPYCSTDPHCPIETLAPAAIIQTCARSMSSHESFLPSTTDQRHYTPGLNFPSRKHYSPSQSSSSSRSNTLSHSRSLPSVAWSSTGTAQSTWSGPLGYPHCTVEDASHNLEPVSFAPEHGRQAHSPGGLPPLLPPPTHLQPSPRQRDSQSLFDTVYEETDTIPRSQYHSGTFPRRKEGSSPHTFHHPAPPGTRSTRSGTISSTNSGLSAFLTTSKSAHPFANTVPNISPPSPPQHTTIILSHHYSQSNPHPHDQQRAMAPPIAYHAQPVHQVSLVSQEDSQDDDETCPICVESLGFSYRLPGEKPHVVPECGHSLHEACFVAVYGPVPRANGPRKLNLGVCGVCRKPMRIGDGDAGRGSNKLAMLMGTGNASDSLRRRIPPALSSSTSRNGLRHNSHLDVSPNSPDLAANDVLEPAVAGSRSVGNDVSGPPPRVVIPSISVRGEYPSISRTKDGVKGKQIITALLSIDVPPAGDRGRYPAPSTNDERHGPPMTRLPSSSGSEGQHDQLSPQLPPSPRSDSSNSHFTAGSSAVLVPLPGAGRHDAFSHVMADLKNRVADYRAHGLESLGPIRMFDLLKVRKGSQIREFHVYLFQEALICVSEEKKRGLRGFLSSSSSALSNSDGTSNGKGILKLKGRIFLRHVRRVFDSTVQGELSLTIVMEDEMLDSFILTFRDRPSHETWKINLTRLMEDAKGASTTTTTPSAGSTSKINRMMGAGAPVPASNGHSQLSTGTPFSPASASRSEDQIHGAASASIRSASTFTNFTSSSPVPTLQSFQQALAPVHTPIDLIIVLSVPSPVAAATSSAAALKTRLIRASLCFALSLMGPKDRISIVTCESGSGGSVRKTPLLVAARKESRKRLESFVEMIGVERNDDDQDEFDFPMNEERQDVVAAVNVGLDVMLQRKNSDKNTLASMILVCDTAESITRAQMDLVLARLEAANIPIHALGYGKAHDPSPLWMLSNNTNGSYTFVKEWYHLRDTLAGVIGGLMSIALTQMKVHLSCQDNEFKVHKISGAAQAVVATNGKDVDIDLRELRHGERKEILIELEIDFSSDRSSAPVSQRGSSDDLTHGLGINALSVAESIRMYDDHMIDEVPVVEVDCSFHDPAAGRSVARLAHPVLLTVAILPKATSPPVADPTVQRRKMELFASDMITRALLLASRRNWSQASRILTESKRMIHVVVQQLQQNPGAPRTKRESQVCAAVNGLGAVMHDMDTLQEGLDDQRDLFDRDYRLYAAQQAMILRGQKSWTTRTSTERLYCTEDTQQIIQLSGEWTART